MSRPEKVYLVSYQEKTETGIQLRVEAYLGKYSAKKRKGLLELDQMSNKSIVAIHDILPVKVME